MKKKRKLTLIISSLRGGGAERVCVTLANGLIESGYIVDLVVLGLKDATMHLYLSGKVNLVNLNVHNARNSVFAINRYLKREKPETVLSFNSEISVIAGILRKLSRLRFKLISRSISFLSISESEKKGIWYGVISNYLIRKFYGLSDLFIAQSKAMATDLENYLRINGSRVTVINNPVSENIEQYLKRNDLSNVNKENYLLCIGRLEEVKAFHYAIKAFAMIADRYPTLKLKIVGKGSLQSELMELAAVQKVNDRVIFEGYQNEIIPYYIHSRATVLTSMYEGFPNVLVESLALGTPVVAFDCSSGPSEIIQNGVNGYLVRHNDLNHLVDCLEAVLNKEWDLQVLINSVEKFRADVIVQEYIKVLNSN